MAESRSEAEVLAEVVRRVRTAELAERMVARFRSEIAGYRRLPEPVVIGQILEICRRNVELFFNSILDGREPQEDDLAAFRESAKDRAGEGMPLEDLLHAYRLGGRMGWQQVVEAATPDERPALLAGAERLMDYVDRVSAVVAQAYLDERQLLVSEEERRLRDLFDALVGGGVVTASLQECAEGIGLALADSYRPFAQTLPGAAAHEHSQIAEALREQGVLALTEGDRVSGLAPASADGNGGGPLWGALAPDALLAVGDSTPRPELADALEEMRLLVDLGRRLGHRGRLDPDAFVCELLLARSPRLGELARQRALGPLEEYARRRGSDLIDTLEAFVAADLDRRGAAEQLHIHPNTLDYRLRRVEELTGLQLGRTDDLTLVSLGLKQRSMSAVDSG